MTAPSAPPNSAAATASATVPAGGEGRLVEETRHQIRELVQEIAQLAQSDVAESEFYAGFASRVVSALAASGCAIWLGEGDALHLAYQANLPAAGLTDDPEARVRHQQLLVRLLDENQPAVVPPRSGSTERQGEPAEEDGGNPTEFLLVVAPLRIGARAVGLVEVFQRSGGGPATHRGYLRFLCQMAELASDYVKTQRLQSVSDREELWQRLERFFARIHQTLDSEQTAYCLANEGRRIIGCDRVSVLLAQANAVEQVAAISGVDVVDPRAAQATKLVELAAAALPIGEPLWYDGSAADLAPAIDDALHAYLEQSHSRRIGVVPLRGPATVAVDAEGNDAPSEPSGPVVGMLVAEDISDEAAHAGFRERVALVAEHGGAALANAREHSGILLLPVWKAVGATLALVQGEGLPRAIVVGLGLALVATALALIPIDFRIQAPGFVQPAIRREIFAQRQGVVADVPIEHLGEVQPEQLLVQLSDPQLEMEIATLGGKLTTLAEKIQSLERSIVEGGRRRRDVEEEDRLTGELLQLRRQAASLRQQRELLRQQREQLAIRSPIHGRVLSWQVRKRLLDRPVERGQALMTLMAADTPWQLEIELPEKHVCQLKQTLAEQAGSADSPRPLGVTFFLATHPGQSFPARVRRIDDLATQTEDGRTFVRVVAEFDKSGLPELRPGATITARLHCGRRCAGYVLFRDLIDFLRTQAAIWLS